MCFLGFHWYHKGTLNIFFKFSVQQWKINGIVNNKAISNYATAVYFHPYALVQTLQYHF